MIRKLFRGIARVFQFLRNTFLNVLVLLLIIGIVIGITSDETTTSVPTDAVLVLNPSGEIVEQPVTEDPFTTFFFEGFYPLRTSVPDIVKALEFAKSDPRVKLLVLDFSRIASIDIAQVERIRKAIRSFKESEKPVWAFSSNMSQVHYLLSLDADVIALDPLGDLVLTGISMTTTYYKGLIDKFNVDMNISVQGDYKSAIEPYIRTDMSDQVKKVNLNLIDNLWGHLSQEIATARGLNEQVVESYAQQIHTIQTDQSLADVALEQGFIDRVVDRKKFDADSKLAVSDSPYPKLKRISLASYLPHVNSWSEFGINRIGVLTIEGAILGLVNSVSQRQSATIRLIEKATKKPEIDALVVHVRSPGGSVFESEYIRRALEKFRETGRPLIASFAGTAASGGYWVALPADEIFATPITITGSIGVFSVYPTLGNTLSEFGITTESLSTSPYSNNLDLFVTPTDELKSLQQLQVDRFYSKFVDLVAHSRSMTPAAVRKVAGGRIWLGTEALGAGLVDKIGDLDDAIEQAAKLAKLDKYEVEYLAPDQPTLPSLSLVLNKMAEIYQADSSNVLRTFSTKSAEVQELMDNNGLYALCSYCAIIP